MRRAFRRIHSLDAEASSIDRPEPHGQPCRHARQARVPPEIQLIAGTHNHPPQQNGASICVANYKDEPGQRVVEESEGG